MCHGGAWWGTWGNMSGPAGRAGLSACRGGACVACVRPGAGWGHDGARRGRRAGAAARGWARGAAACAAAPPCRPSSVACAPTRLAPPRLPPALTHRKPASPTGRAWRPCCAARRWVLRARGDGTAGVGAGAARRCRGLLQRTARAAARASCALPPTRPPSLPPSQRVPPLAHAGHGGGGECPAGREGRAQGAHPDQLLSSRKARPRPLFARSPHATNASSTNLGARAGRACPHPAPPAVPSHVRPFILPSLCWSSILLCRPLFRELCSILLLPIATIRQLQRLASCTFGWHAAGRRTQRRRRPPAAQAAQPKRARQSCAAHRGQASSVAAACKPSDASGQRAAARAAPQAWGATPAWVRCGDQSVCRLVGWAARTMGQPDARRRRRRCRRRRPSARAR